MQQAVIQYIKRQCDISLGQAVLSKGFRFFFYFLYSKIYNTQPADIWQPAREQLFDAFDVIDARRDKRLVINAFPRLGKTTLIIFYIAFLIAKKDVTRKKIIYTSYSGDLLVRCARELKLVLTHPVFTSLYKQDKQMDIVDIKQKNTIDGLETILRKSSAGDNQSIKEIFNTRLFVLSGGFEIRIASMNSGITGFGCDLLILDDPNNPADRFSTKKKQNVIDIFQNVLTSRLDDKRVNSEASGQIVCLQQRVFCDDLSGYLIEKKNFKQLKIKLVDDNGNITLLDKFDEEAVEIEKRDKINFLCQYQQDPPDTTGMEVFNRKEFHLWEGDLQNSNGFFVTTDLSYTKNNDHLCLCFWSYEKTKENIALVLLDIIYYSFDTDINRTDIVKSFVERNKHLQQQGHKKIYFDYILLEENGNLPIIGDFKQINERIYLVSRTKKTDGGYFTGTKADRAMRCWGWKTYIKLFVTEQLNGSEMFETACQEFKKTFIDNIGKPDATDDFCDNIIDAMTYVKYVK